MVGTIRWIPVILTLAVVIAWGAALSSPARPATEPAPHAPIPALTFPAEVISCHDGDTVLVDVRCRATVRLKDVWARELREPGGKEALAHIQRLTASRKCLLSIPLEGARTISDVLTFGRIVGEIWMDGECDSVNMQMVRDGFATREKQR